MPKQKTLSLAKLLHLQKHTKTTTRISTKTGIGQYANIVYQNIDDPEVSVYEAQLYVAKRKAEIETLHKHYLQYKDVTSITKNP